MIALCLLAIINFTDGATLLNKDDSYAVVPCNDRTTVENKCITCVCFKSGNLQCSLKKSGDCTEELNSSCLPNIMYELNNTVCICNASGKWPNAKCNKVFRTLDRAIEVNCKPNTYFNSDCNVCKCGSDGKIDKARCTQNKCRTSTINSRRISNNVYGKCEVGNWYSLAPCQFCFCVNQNKLVCNTGNVYAQKLELGAYNLSVCGKELIREAVELIPENLKALRINKETVTEPPVKINKITLGQHNIEVNVNREESNLNKNKNANDQTEYYTDSEEEEQPELKGREDLSIPVQVDKENRKENKHYEDLETDESEVEIEKPVREKVVKEFEINLQGAHNKPETIDHLPDSFNLGEALKLNLPMALDKVFQMALRKTMVVVDSDTKCTAGAATILKCNVCFCMKENKLICTNNEC